MTSFRVANKELAENLDGFQIRASEGRIKVLLTSTAFSVL
jgi:hypothetical protein